MKAEYDRITKKESCLICLLFIDLCSILWGVWARINSSSLLYKSSSVFIMRVIVPVALLRNRCDYRKTKHSCNRLPTLTTKECSLDNRQCASVCVCCFYCKIFEIFSTLYRVSCKWLQCLLIILNGTEGAVCSISWKFVELWSEELHK